MGIPVLKQTTEFRIEKGVEIPKRSGDATRKYPFPQMEVGDSFAVPSGRHLAVSTAATNYGNKYQMKFSVRAVDGGHRCWRIA